MIKLKKSKKNSINWRDTLRGLLVGSLTAGVLTLQQGLSTGNPNWSQVGMSAGAGALGYIIKNFFEDEK